jgi:hypothetical protein
MTTIQAPNLIQIITLIKNTYEALRQPQCELLIVHRSGSRNVKLVFEVLDKIYDMGEIFKHTTFKSDTKFSFKIDNIADIDANDLDIYQSIMGN